VGNTGRPELRGSPTDVPKGIGVGKEMSGEETEWQAIDICTLGSLWGNLGAESSATWLCKSGHVILVCVYIRRYSRNVAVPLPIPELLLLLFLGVSLATD